MARLVWNPGFVWQTPIDTVFLAEWLVRSENHITSNKRAISLIRCCVYCGLMGHCVVAGADD